MRRKLWALLIWFSIICLSLAGCKSAAPEATEAPTIVPETATPAPSETPTPIPGRVVLFIPPDYVPGYTAEIQTAVSELAPSTGLVLDIRNSLQASDIEEDWRVVVLLTEPINLNELLTAAPQTQFVVISDSDIATAANLTVIRRNPEYQAAVAGFLSIVIANDWRSAGLFASDTIGTQGLQDAFLNGAYYYCGRCSSVYMPVVSFPRLGVLPVNSDLATWQATLEGIQQDIVYVYYVSPEVASPELLGQLAASGVILVGGNPPSDQVRGNWAATIGFDLTGTLRNLWPELTAGQGGKTVVANIALTDVQPAYFSSGRQRLVIDFIEVLQTGDFTPASPIP